MLGQALSQKSLPGAIDALRTAHRLAPRVGQVAFALASELRKSGSEPSSASDAAEAAGLYRIAIKLAPALGDAKTYLNLGMALTDSTRTAPAADNDDSGGVGDDDEAVAAWSVAAALAPGW
eukprot:2913124-Prymnesium_polylepis.1